MKAPWIGVSVVLLLLAFVVIDCSSGSTQVFSCQVVDHKYQPPYITTDDDGDITTHHEEFHVLCQVKATREVLDIETTRAIYYTTTNEQPVIVRSRRGRWTSTHYMPVISLDLRPEL